MTSFAVLSDFESNFNSNMLHTSRSFLRTVEVTIQSPTTARMLRHNSRRDPMLL